jgi:ABC-type branched-subunit amino acid transport system substrate-binding protein
MKRIIFITVALFVCSLTLNWGGAIAQGKEPIKIGVPMTLSGMAAQVGVDNRNGIVLAAKHKKTYTKTGP